MNKFTGHRLLCSGQIIALLAILWGAASMVHAQNCLPSGPISFRVDAGTSSYAPPTFTGLTTGCAVTNGTYSGWCVEYTVLIEKGPVYAGELYDSLDSSLPLFLQGIPWNRLNHILNHKVGDVSEIQNAIWVSLGQSFDPPFTTNSQAMVDAADQLGPSFVPAIGQVRAIILQPTTAVQRLVFEVTVGETNNGGALRLSDPRSLSDGAFKFFLNGPPGSYAIEVSTNLNTWVTLTTLELVDLPVPFTDTNASPVSLRFYRASKN
jgi:hypothetical protein